MKQPPSSRIPPQIQSPSSLSHDPTALASHLHRLADDLVPFADALREGVFVCDRTGRVLHQNGAATELLAADPEQARIQEELEVLSRSLDVLARGRKASALEESSALVANRIRTTGREYHLRGTSLVNADGSGPLLLIVLRSMAPGPISDEQLRREFGLTERQSRVARLIAEGRTTGEIAKRLAIRAATVRHHVAQVLTKLGVHSRVEVGPRLYGRLSEPARMELD
jgi:DNA-binding CsgD family transcriptional regulator